MVVRRGMRLARSLQHMVSQYSPGDLVYIWSGNTQPNNFFLVVVKADKRTGMLTLDPANGGPYVQVMPDAVIPHPAIAQRISIERNNLDKIEQVSARITDF